MLFEKGGFHIPGKPIFGHSTVPRVRPRETRTWLHKLLGQRGVEHRLKSLCIHGAGGLEPDV